MSINKKYVSYSLLLIKDLKNNIYYLTCIGAGGIFLSFFGIAFWIAIIINWSFATYAIFLPIFLGGGLFFLFLFWFLFHVVKFNGRDYGFFLNDWYKKIYLTNKNEVGRYFFNSLDIYFLLLILSALSLFVLFFILSIYVFIILSRIKKIISITNTDEGYEKIGYSFDVFNQKYYKWYDYKKTVTNLKY